MVCNVVFFFLYSILRPEYYWFVRFEEIANPEVPMHADSWNAVLFRQGRSVGDWGFKVLPLWSFDENLASDFENDQLVWSSVNVFSPKVTR